MSKAELACALPWREIVGEANFSLSQTSKGELACTLPWREIEGEVNLSLSQTSKGELAYSLPWREIVGTAKFKEDFLKVVDFVHYLKAGDMIWSLLARLVMVSNSKTQSASLCGKPIFLSLIYRILMVR